MSQLRALGPDNAAVITPAQRAALTEEQRAAVDEVVGLVAKTSEPTTVMPQKGGMVTIKAIREAVSRQVKKRPTVNIVSCTP